MMTSFEDTVSKLFFLQNSGTFIWTQAKLPRNTLFPSTRVKKILLSYNKQVQLSFQELETNNPLLLLVSQMVENLYYEDSKKLSNKNENLLICQCKFSVPTLDLFYFKTNRNNSLYILDNVARARSHNDKIPCRL